MQVGSHELQEYQSLISQKRLKTVISDGIGLQVEVMKDNQKNLL